MGVGMIDIIARGQKDVWIKKPKDTSLKKRQQVLHSYILKVFHKHVPYIQETRVLPFSGTNFGKSAKIVIPNFCDLYSGLFLQLNVQSFLRNIDDIDLRDYSPVNPEDNFGYTQYLLYSCIERIQLYAGKTKIDEYTGLELFHRSVEKYNPTQRMNLRRKTGYYPQTTPYDHSNVYKNQGGDLYIRLPFDLINGYRPLPTIIVQGSPLEIRIQFRKLENVIYPKQDIQQLSRRTILYRNSSGDEITANLQKPKLKYAYLHIEGSHIDEGVKQEIQNELLSTNIIPFTSYDTQEFLMVDPTYTQNQICIGTQQKIPAVGDTANYPFSLEFQNPVQSFSLYAQLQNNPETNLYYLFKIHPELQNSSIINRIGLQVHGQVIYPKLRSQYYTQVTPYVSQGQNLLNTSYMIPLNIYNKDLAMNYGYVDYGKVSHSTLEVEVTGWDGGGINRTTKMFIVAKIYKKLESKNGRLTIHPDF